MHGCDACIPVRGACRASSIAREESTTLSILELVYSEVNVQEEPA